MLASARRFGCRSPLPLDTKGDPVTRHIRITGLGGLDEDEDVAWLAADARRKT